VIISFIFLSLLVVLYEYKTHVQGKNKNKKAFICTLSLVIISILLLFINKAYPSLSLVKIHLFINEKLFPDFVRFMKT